LIFTVEKTLYVEYKDTPHFGCADSSYGRYLPTFQRNLQLPADLTSTGNLKEGKNEGVPVEPEKIRYIQL
jgi:hypothetical protein